MRVLTVVALASPHGDYGGPTRVAVNQAVELQRQGHDVTIAAGARGYAELPTSLDGVPAALFPARQLLPGTGFAGLAAPGLRRALPRLAASVDIIHVHLARDLVTLPVAAWARHHGIPYVVQTHGMIAPTANPLAGPLDAVMTRRVLRSARQVLYLTPREQEELVEVGGADLALSQLGNGVPLPEEARAPSSAAVELLYLARLAPRKRPGLFVELARRLAEEFPQVVFRLVGPDEGAAAEVEKLIDEAGSGVNVRWEGPIPPEAVAARMARASVYVLPAIDEPYPMSVLEAMAMGIPVVITDSCGLAPLVRDSGCGVVVGSGADELVDGVRGLLDSPQRAAECGRLGRRAAEEHLGMAAVVRRLEEAYRV